MKTNDRERLQLFGALLVAWILIMWILLSTRGMAQDPIPGASQTKGGFFNDAQVDFWGEKQDAKAKNVGKKADSTATSTLAATTKELWNEPAVSADGRLTSYAPPKVLQELLNNPTAENALRYLEWQRERMERILRAQQAVRKAMSALREREEEQKPKENDEEGRPPDRNRKGESETPPPNDQKNKPASLPQDPQKQNAQQQLPESSNPSREPFAWKELELVYFFSPDCPFCASQEKVLNGLAGGDGPTITRIDITQRAELALALGIGGTPTILISRKGRAQVARLEGLQEERSLAAAAAGLFEEEKQKK